MRICPSCGEENPERFRLCGFCGAPLAAPAPPREVRKTVTVVFCDLKGSTALGERLDSEAVREVLDAYFTEMRGVLERHGGLVEKYIGDAIMAVFGLPRLHEDDALRAVRAAHQMRAALTEVNRRLESRWGVRLENRTGVNTGEVVAGDPASGQRLVTGDTVNVAARLEQAAPPLEVLLGETTYRLVRDAVEVEALPALELKGKSEPIAAYQLLGVGRGDGMARRADTPLVGRAEELAVLTAALERVASRRTPELVTVLAPAGTGKSRLLHEFLGGTAGRARVLRGRCLSYGEGITFWPLAEIARDAAGIAEDEAVDQALAKLTALLGEGAADAADRLASVMGLSEAAYPVRETFWAARRLLQIVARAGPVVTVIEDVHWAESTFLDLVDYLADGGEDAALLLLCTSRPELLELRPAWREVRPRARSISLRPLSDAESAEVVSGLLGEVTLAAEPRRRIVEAAQGNPLFVEQMVSMMIDDGLIRREGGGWVATSDLGSLAVPPSISALLTARLDRLAPTERAVLERGAVIGQVFYLEAVESLCPEGLRPDVRPSLDSLGRRELVSPTESNLAGQEAFRFQHVLIRDAAYQGLLKRTRAELHESFAEWLEARAGDHPGDHEEIRGYHLEQSVLSLAQLGPLDAHTAGLGRRAAGYLAAAGERARARGDMPAAASLLRRAAALAPDSPARPRWLLLAGEALGEMGSFILAGEVLSSAADQARQDGDRALAATASVVAWMWRFLANPEAAPAGEVTAAGRAAIAELERLDAHEGLARAWKLMMYVHFYEGRFSPAEECVSRAVRHAELAHDTVFEVRLLSALASCLVYSATPAAEALDRCRSLLEQGAGDRRTEAMTLSAMSHLEAMRGEAEPAREHYRRSRAMLTDLGFTLSAAITSLHSGPAEILAGDLERAEAELRADYETLQAIGDTGYTPSVAALLAEVLHAQGRDREAGELADVCREKASPHDVGAQYQWRSIRARLLGTEGRIAEAETLARESVRLIRTTDQPDVQGQALAGLAEVLEAAGKGEDAATSLREAVALFEAKGNAVAAARARRELERLTASPRAVPRARDGRPGRGIAGARRGLRA
jgi:class 3 adenylate cyclase/tetratricopeptide (TPR) repeat protein